ncbi:hypothetical protein DIPPA_22234 [Diplonema papillatum]|nr:hypothetical protein DIPPA_22234 [Diplonema papillatum]
MPQAPIQQMPTTLPMAQVDVADLKPVALHKSLEKKMKGVGVYTCIVADKLSTKWKKQRRLLVATAAMLLVCDASGSVKRIIDISEIDDILFQQDPDAVYVLFKVKRTEANEPDLLVSIVPDKKNTHDPATTASIIGALTRARKPFEGVKFLLAGGPIKGMTKLGHNPVPAKEKLKMCAEKSRSATNSERSTDGGESTDPQQAGFAKRDRNSFEVNSVVLDSTMDPMAHPMQNPTEQMQSFSDGHGFTLPIEAQASYLPSDTPVHNPIACPAKRPNAALMPPVPPNNTACPTQLQLNPARSSVLGGLAGYGGLDPAAVGHGKLPPLSLMGAGTGGDAAPKGFSPEVEVISTSKSRGPPAPPAAEKPAAASAPTAALKPRWGEGEADAAAPAAKPLLKTRLRSVSFSTPKPTDIQASFAEVAAPPSRPAGGGSDEEGAAAGWTEHRDPVSQLTYYHNDRLGKSTWHVPDELKEKKKAGLPLTVGAGNIALSRPGLAASRKSVLVQQQEREQKERLMRGQSKAEDSESEVSDDSEEASSSAGSDSDETGAGDDSLLAPDSPAAGRAAPVPPQPHAYQHHGNARPSLAGNPSAATATSLKGIAKLLDRPAVRVQRPALSALSANAANLFPSFAEQPIDDADTSACAPAVPVPSRMSINRKVEHQQQPVRAPRFFQEAVHSRDGMDF